jgi:hypothetical protein
MADYARQPQPRLNRTLAARFLAARRSGYPKVNFGHGFVCYQLLRLSAQLAHRPPPEAS